MTARTLMVQGSSSSAGKSLLVTALCHSYARKGLRVAPFKAQNMSNNAAVCPDGSEIGRAQYVQALAAGIEPSAEINPILIKPEADSRSQVIVMGKPLDTLDARVYYGRTEMLWGHVTKCLDSLRQRYDLVIIEGAGSPAEINLKAGDIVNMAVARYAGSPVLLVGDIDRGGIFAQLLGTLWLLEPEERALVSGLVVNKFRGDLALFADGIQILESKGGVPVLGVIPYLKELHIPEEDAVALEQLQASNTDAAAQIDIAVIHLPRISNFDDFDPFIADPGVQVRYVHSPQNLGLPDAIIIPGTKSTVGDLSWLRASGFAEAIIDYTQKGGALVGICGGYQMLGTAILDPDHIEAPTESTPGLGLLPIQTLFNIEKATYQARARLRAAPGWFANLSDQVIEGYEIHMGRTRGSNPCWLEINSRNGKPVSIMDGTTNADGRIWGCYLHGLFANQSFRRAWLSSLGWSTAHSMDSDSANLFSHALTQLTDAVEAALDMKQLEAILWGNSY